MPTNIVNFAAERTRREVDIFLEDLATVKQHLLNVSAVAGADEATKQLADILVALADRLAEIGIAQLSAAIVMDDDFKRRLQQLQREAPATPSANDLPLLTLMKA